MQIGIIANPNAGKDIRRLTAGASVSSTEEKVAVVRRFLAALCSSCCPDIHYLDDSGGIVRSALRSLGIQGQELDVQSEGLSTDSECAADKLRGVDLVVSLGGDGTNRAITKGWRDIPLIALSTGTNNAWASMTEATSAGIAAGHIARKHLDEQAISVKSKVVHVSFDDNRNDSLALVDVVGTHDKFTGARAIVDPEQYAFAVVTQADAAKIGMVGVAGACMQVRADEKRGAALTFNVENETSRTVRTAIAPGLVRDVRIVSCEELRFNQCKSFSGPMVVAFDGEREEYLAKDQTVNCVVKQDGPRLFDVSATLREASRLGLLTIGRSREVSSA
ncbi:MAG: NAD(+)/NADH kinase [Gammaproteobacteria bacterium]|nr:NAD(+)/NADH kinase [Gammaproteobacteria bacterium]